MKRSHPFGAKNELVPLSIALVIFLMTVGGAMGFLFFQYRSDRGVNLEEISIPGMHASFTPVPAASLIVAEPSVSPIASLITTPSKTERVVLDIDFVSQAPYRIWDEIHNEACEEANIIMVYAWIKSIKPTAPFVEQEIQRLTQWGLARFGSYDTSATQTALMAKEVYGLESRLINDPSIEDIKAEIDKGHVVIMGMAGRLLASPYYRPPGPKYHMLLIKGYDGVGFITNDVGTNQLGRDFFFSYSNIMTAAHDWNGSFETLLDSPAVALVVSKDQ